MFIVLLVIVTVMAMATTALAGRPDKPGKPEPPDIWTCAERVDNGAVWVPGEWDGTSYVSKFDPKGDVGVPLCIDLDEVAAHKHVTNWSVRWEGTARKAPKGLMLVFEEEVHATHYGEKIGYGLEETLYFDLALSDVDENDVFDNEHLVFLAMPRQGDKWTNITFWVTPNPVK
jgi:hypothetical protein